MVENNQGTDIGKNRNSLGYMPNIVVFLASMSIMIMELSGSRIISKYLGNSLFTWTGVIGIVLAGISFGNWTGGKLADKFLPEKIMPIQLFTASFLVFNILILDLVIGWFMGGTGEASITVLWILQSLLVIVILFFLPAACLGTISPVMAKFALSRSSRVGNTVGNIYASASAGAILGTFLSGYILIPILGVRSIVFIVSFVLSLLGVWVSRTVSFKKGTSAGLGWVGIILVGFLLWGGHRAEGKAPEIREDGVLYTNDSPYSHITVENTEGGTKRILIMDGLIHNMFDLTGSNKLVYEYERIFLALTEAFLDKREQTQNPESRDKFRSLTLGGGAMTFPSYLTRAYPKASHTVVEIDPRVVEVAFRYFNAPRVDSLKVHTMDARIFVQGSQGTDTLWDLICLDAFNSFSIPYHITTKEFSRGVRSLLHPEGIVVANAIDIPMYGRFLGAYFTTLSAVFPYVRIYGSPHVDWDRRSTFVIAASNTPIPFEELRDSAGTLIARPLDPSMLEDILKRNGQRLLTDDFAPVESLMIPVFLDMIR